MKVPPRLQSLADEGLIDTVVRQARAMAKGTRFGRQAQEAAWQSAEVDAVRRLAAAGVRVSRTQVAR